VNIATFLIISRAEGEVSGKMEGDTVEGEKVMLIMRLQKRTMQVIY
jgi:hypothetical protein